MHHPSTIADARRAASVADRLGLPLGPLEARRTFAVRGKGTKHHVRPLTLQLNRKGQRKLTNCGIVGDSVLTDVEVVLTELDLCDKCDPYSPINRFAYADCWIEVLTRLDELDRVVRCAEQARPTWEKLSQILPWRQHTLFRYETHRAGLEAALPELHRAAERCRVGLVERLTAAVDRWKRELATAWSALAEHVGGGILAQQAWSLDRALQLELTSTCGDMFRLTANQLIPAWTQARTGSRRLMPPMSFPDGRAIDRLGKLPPLLDKDQFTNPVEWLTAEYRARWDQYVEVAMAFLDAELTKLLSTEQVDVIIGVSRFSSVRPTPVATAADKVVSSTDRHCDVEALVAEYSSVIASDRGGDKALVQCPAVLASWWQAASHLVERVDVNVGALDDTTAAVALSLWEPYDHGLALDEALLAATAISA